MWLCTVGYTVCSLGIYNAAASYVAATPKDAGYDVNGGYFLIGKDFETYSGKSGQLLSGVNTLGSDLYFSCHIGAMASSAIFDLMCNSSERWNSKCSCMNKYLI